MADEIVRLLRVPSAVKAQWWETEGYQYEYGAGVFVTHGAQRKKGQTAKEALIENIAKIVKLAYEAGIDRGYVIRALEEAGTDVAKQDAQESCDND